MFSYLDLPFTASSPIHISGLTLDCQFFSFFFIFVFTYLDLPSSASLAVLWLYRTCLPDWTYTSDARLVGIWDFLQTLICPNHFLFFSKVFLKLLSSGRTFSLCIPVSDKEIYIWCNVLCNVWSWMTCPSILNSLFFWYLNLCCSSVLGFFAFSRPCVPYGLARLVYHASILSLKSIFTPDVFLSCHNFLCIRVVILRFNCRRHTRLTSIFPCWILTNLSLYCQ